MTADLVGPGASGLTHAYDGHRSFVYRAFDADGTLLYVGQTGYLPERLAIHRRTTPWWHTVADVVTEGPFSRVEALRREREVMWTDGPIYNQPPPSTVRRMWPETSRAVSPRAARPAPALPVGRAGAHQP